MPRLKLVIEYDGAPFVGWQRQKNGRSVQEAFEQALASLLGSPIRVEAAGRTDAGVHAAGQVVSFVAPRELPLQAYTRGLNGLLPKEISVRSAEVVRNDFDPRRWATGKRYRYLISNRTQRSALRRNSHWEIFTPLDADAMREAAAPLLGRHDFSAFRAADCQAAHAVRELRTVAVARPSGDEVAIEVEGTAFLKHMIRNIVGSLVEVGKGRQSVPWVREVLESRDRTRAGPTAPAQGLTLTEVSYGPGPRDDGAEEEELE